VGGPHGSSSQATLVITHTSFKPCLAGITDVRSGVINALFLSVSVMVPNTLLSSCDTFPVSYTRFLLVTTGKVGEFKGVSVLRRAGIFAGSWTVSTGTRSLQTAESTGFSSSVKHEIDIH